MLDQPKSAMGIAHLNECIFHLTGRFYVPGLNGVVVVNIAWLLGPV